MKPIETVLIRDPRFRRYLTRTATGANEMLITDDSPYDMKIDFYKFPYDYQKLMLEFFNVSI